MGVYRRHDSSTYWMSLVIDGKRVRQDTGVQDRTSGGRNLRRLASAGGPSQMAGSPRPHPAAHGAGPLDGVSGQGDAAEISRLTTAGSRGLGAIQEALGNLRR